MNSSNVTHPQREVSGKRQTIYNFWPKLTCPKSTTRQTAIPAHFNEHLSSPTHWARGDRHPLILRLRERQAAEPWTLHHGNGQKEWRSASRHISSWTHRSLTASERHLAPITLYKTITLSINYMLPELLLKSFLIYLAMCVTSSLFNWTVKSESRDSSNPTLL